MFKKEEIEELLFLVKNIPMDDPKTTELVLKYVRILKELIEQWTK